MSSSSSSSSQPTIAQFTGVLATESRWYDLGVFLGVPTHHLDTISSNHGEDTIRCLIEVYKSLESSDEIPSWECISHSLRTVGNHNLANRIYSESILPRLSPVSTDQDTDTGMRDLDVSPVREDLPRSKSDSDLIVVGGSSENEISVVKAVAIEFETLHKRFVKLVAKIKKAFRESRVDIDHIQDVIKGLCGLEPLEHDQATINSILDRLDPHYSILNIGTLDFLIGNFLKQNQKLRKKMKNYKKEIEKFKSFAKMEHLVDIIKTKRSSRSNHKTMKLKVREFWGKVTMKKFEEVMNEILETLHEGVSYVSVVKGCLCVSWIVPDTHTSKMFTPSLELLRVIGVISLHIGDEEIFRAQEEGCEVMEAAMLQAIELKNTRAIELLLTLGCDPEVAARNGELAVTTIVNFKESDETYERGSTMKQVCVLGHDKNVEAIIRGDRQNHESDFREKMLKSLLVENADLKRRLAETGRNRESDLREKMLKNLLVENADLKRRLAETDQNRESDLKEEMLKNCLMEIANLKRRLAETVAGEGDHKPTDNKFMREDLAEQMEEAQELLEDVKKKTEVREPLKGWKIVENIKEKDSSALSHSSRKHWVTPPFHGKPTVQELDEQLRDLVDWERFAIRLPGIEQVDIEIIKQDNFKIPDRKHVLFERWLRKYLSASWDDVILALELIDESHLAHSVQANRKQWVTPPFHGNPTVHELNEELRDLVKWKRFAIHLPEITQMDIEIIERDYPSSIYAQKHALFETWLRMSFSASWDDVVLALEAIGENHLAQTIQTNKKQWATPPFHGKPTVRDLDDQLRDLVEWRRFAIQLPEIAQMDIEIIKREFPNSISDQKCALFDRWLRIYPSASWDDVVLALEAIGENHLAQTIQTNKKQWATPPFHGKPTVRDLDDQLRDLVEWRRFAIQLPEIAQMDIEIIKREFPNSISDQKCALFDRWLRIYPSASWDVVVSALEASDENHLAQTIQANKKQWVTPPFHGKPTVRDSDEQLEDLVNWERFAIH